MHSESHSGAEPQPAILEEKICNQRRVVEPVSKRDLGVRPNCQAVPMAARRGWREDQLCASLAHADVPFHGRLVPVCGMHLASYRRWGREAEANAAMLWGWSAHPTTDVTTDELPASYAMPY